MTLVVTINGPETIWLMADRRLSAGGKSVKEDAHKIMLLESVDGAAILGYAGLGATARGTQPADWMSAAVRGRNHRLVEDYLAILAEAMKRQLPKHLSGLCASHVVMIPAFIGNSEQATLFSIDLTLASDGKGATYNKRRWVSPPPAKPNSPPRFGLAGSGAVTLLQWHEAKKQWARDILRLVRAADRRQVSPIIVADRLAKLNYDVHARNPSGSVGKRCIVAWRHRNSFHGGGGLQYYDGSTRERNSEALPCISRGMDIRAIGTLFMKQLPLEKLLDGDSPKEIDKDKMNAELSALPSGPDEDLR